MRITKVELKNFKRFTDLTIDGIPADTKLVLLIGANGSGKSSVFDAFGSMNKLPRIDTSYINLFTQGQVEGRLSSQLYSLRKDTKSPAFIRFYNEEGASFHFGLPVLIRSGVFYGRSSFRYVPRLTRRQTDDTLTSAIEGDADGPLSFIDRDNRFENDIDRISGQILRELFRDTSTAEQIRANYIGAINDAFSRVFQANANTRLTLFEILPPLEGKPAQINFKKGNSEVPYDYLSAGEKEVLNILMNLLVRREFYTDTVYFFDELDLHLNTQLQFNLLEELVQNWIPDNCQLWTASHSLGFIDYARQYKKGVIIDFDDLDFDQPQTLFPQPKEQLDVYDIAVPKEMLFEIMKGKKVVACENKNDEFYNLLALSNTIFVGMENSRSIFLQVKNDPRYHSIRDRDFLSDTEIERIKAAYPNHHILRYYNFENYLYHPDNLAELNILDFDREAYVAAITQYKRARYEYILPTLVSSRQTYEEFKTNPKLKDETTDAIVDDFRSDEFERFYKYFNMKNQHERVDPSLGRLSQKRLVQTRWFRQQIDAVLNR